MKLLQNNSTYIKFIDYINNHSICMLRTALAIVYIWFGGLKIIGTSPAEELVTNTVYWWKPEIFLPLLGLCEVLIGLGLLIKKLIPLTILLLLMHMMVTFFPVLILKKTCFDIFPVVPTLVGQYIIKNIVLITGALVVLSKFNTVKNRS